MLYFLTHCLSILFLVRLFIWDIPDKLTAGQLTSSMEQGLTWKEHKCSAGQEIQWRSVFSALWHHVVWAETYQWMCVSKFLPRYSTTHHTRQQSSQAMPKEYQVPPTAESENNAKYTEMLDEWAYWCRTCINFNTIFSCKQISLIIQSIKQSNTTNFITHTHS
jgi:hypothetical protein